MNTYQIYHAIRSASSPTENQPREYIATIMADDIHDAFRRSNSIDEAWHETARSSSIGDVIYDTQADLYMLVMPIGFKCIEVEDLGCEPVLV